MGHFVTLTNSHCMDSSSEHFKSGCQFSLATMEIKNIARAFSTITCASLWTSIVSQVLRINFGEIAPNVQLKWSVYLRRDASVATLFRRSHYPVPTASIVRKKVTAKNRLYKETTGPGTKTRLTANYFRPPVRRRRGMAKIGTCFLEPRGFVWTKVHEKIELGSALNLLRKNFWPCNGNH